MENNVRNGGDADELQAHISNYSEVRDKNTDRLCSNLTKKLLPSTSVFSKLMVAADLLVLISIPQVIADCVVKALQFLPSPLWEIVAVMVIWSESCFLNQVACFGIPTVTTK